MPPAPDLSSAPVAEVIAHLDALLQIDGFEDYGPNGLQVPGGELVSTVLTAVSGQLQVFRRAAELGAELVIVHHGILWDHAERRIDPRQAERLRALLAPRIALAAYHLPLDAHSEHGNNALIAAGLGLTECQPFARHRSRAIGVWGRLPGDGIPVGELVRRIAELTEREPLCQGGGPDRVLRIGIVSGGGADSLPEAISLGLDAFITGEPREHSMADAAEAGVHFLAAGHYATETFGVRRLGDLVAEHFGLRHLFLDVPNPV